MARGPVMSTTRASRRRPGAWQWNCVFSVASAAPVAAIRPCANGRTRKTCRHSRMPPPCGRAPLALNRLTLKVVVEPRVPQVVWYVDGEPFAVTDPDKPVLWPIQPGTHRFQV